MASVVLKVLVAVFVAVVALTGPRVSAQTHHVVGGDGGWGPALDVTSWLSGRVFRVGDKILFKYSGKDDAIIELEGPEEFESCNLANPIRMYTDHVELEKEGSRYFTSANPESCKNGLKLHVPVHSSHEYDPSSHEFWPPSHEFVPPSHEYGPPSHGFEPPSHEFGPPSHEYGPPPPEYGPPEPVRPPPAYVPPPPGRPSAATYLNGLSSVLFVGLLISYMSM